MSSTNPNNTLTPAEVEHLNKLEAIVRRGLDADRELGNALADISDASLYRANNQTFEGYLRDRWGIRRSPEHQLPQAAGTADPPSTDRTHSSPATEPQERPLTPIRDKYSLTNVWEHARHMCGDDGVTAVDIRVTVHRRKQPAERTHEPRPNPGRPDDPQPDELLARLAWLLTQSTGTIADVAHHLEARAADLDDDAREQLRDDVLALHEELATLNALLEPVDWDAEHGRLLTGEIPPFQDDPDDGRDE